MAKRKKQEPTPVAAVAAPGRRLLPYISAAVAVVAVVAAIGIGILVLSGGGGDDKGTALHPGGGSAVIVDQLELTQPNPEFVSQVRETLAAAGYTVDYIPGENVTVDFYRTLPEKGYDIVILRAHAGITTEVDAATGERTGTEYVSLFTGEPYDETKYPQEQLNRLGKARYTPESEPLFGIGPEFVKTSMEGDFGDALIVMMGCDGLRSQRTAEAFLGRGAGAFVSWSKPVSAPHTDTATEKLLERYLLEEETLEQAVQDTAAELGPDPSYEGELRILTG